MSAKHLLHDRQLSGAEDSAVKRTDKSPYIFEVFSSHFPYSHLPGESEYSDSVLQISKRIRP
jgi:hypothetical protein